MLQQSATSKISETFGLGGIRVIVQSVLEQKTEQVCSRTKKVVVLCSRTEFGLEQEMWLYDCARTLARFLFKC